MLNEEHYESLRLTAFVPTSVTLSKRVVLCHQCSAQRKSCFTLPLGQADKLCDNLSAILLPWKVTTVLV